MTIQQFLRSLKMIRALRTYVTAEHFDLRAVIGHKDDRSPVTKSEIRALRNRNPSCGTVACAIGWTTAIFPNLVKVYLFHLELKDHGRWYSARYELVAEELFGMNSSKAISLFSGSNQDTNLMYGMNAVDVRPSQVADAMQNWLYSNPQARRYMYAYRMLKFLAVAIMVTAALASLTLMIKFSMP